MTKLGRTVTAVLLTLVLLAALGILSTTLPTATALPAPIDVTLDFDTFVPGETQVQTYPLVVPSAARFAEAGIIHATGIAQDVEWTFRLCDAASGDESPVACALVRPDADVVAGTYTLEVTALLDARVSGEGTVLGRVRLEQADGAPGTSLTSFHWLIVAAMGAIVIGGIVAVLSTDRSRSRARSTA